MTERDDLPDPTQRLRQPSWRELRHLRQRLRARTTSTPLERVVQEVGETVYAEMMRELLETTVVISNGVMFSLPPELY